MNTLSVVSQRPVQKLHPLSIFSQLMSHQVSGCLQVTSGSTVWSIYLDQGKLSFATSSVAPFDRLDLRLQHISEQAPKLVTLVRARMRSLFENQSAHAGETRLLASADYQAIHWLVTENHLSPEQAQLLIQELAQEVLEPFLDVTEGSYQLVNKVQIQGYPSLCSLDLRPLVEACQMRSRQRKASERALSSLSHGEESPMGAFVPPVAAAFPVVSTPVATAVSAQSPAGFGESAAFGVPAAKGPGMAVPAVEGVEYTIACIDDSPTVLQAIKNFLEDSGVSVVMINDPVKALMQIIRCKPDLILLDVGMPNLDGYELCSLLRKNSNFKQIPIVMVTGNTGFIDRAKAKLVGATGYLTKPFTRSELNKMVFKHLPVKDDAKAASF